MLEFKNHTIFFGDSLSQFSEIRDILDQNHIPYKYRIHNPNGSFSPGMGMRRSLGGNTMSSLQNRYEILVSKQNEDLANYLISRYCG